MQFSNYKREISSKLQMMRTHVCNIGQTERLWICAKLKASGCYASRPTSPQIQYITAYSYHGRHSSMLHTRLFLSVAAAACCLL
jgi:hypothetical protein